MQFLEWNCKNADYDITEVYSLGWNQKYHSIGSDNVLAPYRRQAIIWSNDGQVCWRIYASLGLYGLKLHYFAICCTRHDKRTKIAHGLMVDDTFSGGNEFVIAQTHVKNELIFIFNDGFSGQFCRAGDKAFSEPMVATITSLSHNESVCFADCDNLRRTIFTTNYLIG